MKNKSVIPIRVESYIQNKSIFARISKKIAYFERIINNQRQYNEHI